MNNKNYSSKSVLLLYPEMPDTFWSMKYLIQLMGKKSSYPPLGLLTIASLLPKEWKIELVDLNVEPLKTEILIKYDFVFISAMNVQCESAKKAIRLCKRYSKTVVAGGPLFTHEYESFPEVDHFVLNEAEITLPQFLHDLENGNLKRVYSSNLFSDMSTTPIPRWDLVNLSKYAYAIVQYSRGCPYLCDFCDVTTLFGREPRVKNSTQVISELDEILKYSTPEMILFADDNLIGNKKRLKNELLPALIEWRSSNKWAPGFATQVTINLADDEELMQLLIDAGFRHIFVGIETPEESGLIESRKKQNVKRQLSENIKTLHDRGFIVTGGFIVGFDSDDETIFKKQEEFINKNGIVIATINVLKAPIGTELYKRLMNENRISEPFDFDENKTNIILKMEKSLFYKGFGELLQSVYTPQNVYKRARNWIEHGGSSRAMYPIRRRYRLDDILTLLRVLWRVGILGEESRHFWRLIIFTIINKPKRIVIAFGFLGLMYQFRKMYERYIRVSGSKINQ